MNKSYKHILRIVAAGILMTAGVYQTQATRKYITVSPAPNALTPDTSNNAQLDIRLNIPPHYMSKRSRVVITPQLMAGDSVLEEFDPVVVYAPIYTKKVLRRMVLHNEIDPYFSTGIHLTSTSKDVAIPYSENIQLPAGIETARIIAVVSTDGCGQCTGFETVDVASVGSPLTLLDLKSMKGLTWIEPEFKIREKIHHGKGEARLQFIVDKWDIVLDLANNRAELTDMLEKLSPILQDSLTTLTSLDIFGSASAEASYQHNIMLANNRANSAVNWLSSQLALPKEVRRIIKKGAAPEGWEPVVQAMIAADDPDSIKVRELMIKYPGPTDDAAEKYIRRLACWPRIKKNYLAKDRKVLYNYSWTVKSFTDDAELLDMYKKRPDAFNEDEFLRVASLAVDDNSRKQVYQTLLTYFPESAVAANNLALLYINEGEVDKARKVLESQKNLTPEQINTLASAYIEAGDYDRAYTLLEGVDAPEVRYNLGLVLLKQNKLEQAYELLKSFDDVNTAILALSLNKNNDARQIMSRITANDPMSEYVRAMISARDNNAEGVMTHLRNACADYRLRRRAMDEADFSGIKNDPRFKAIVNP